MPGSNEQEMGIEPIWTGGDTTNPSGGGATNPSGTHYEAGTYYHDVIVLLDRSMRPFATLSERAGNLTKYVRTEEINGEHSLSITTNVHLEIGTRAVTTHYEHDKQDGRQLGYKMCEWVLDEANESHQDGEYGENEYHFCWSIQSDLKGVYGPTQQPGMAKECSAETAVSCALAGSKLWKATSNSADDSMRNVRSAAIMPFGDSAWDRLTTVVKYWGGEIEVLVYFNRLYGADGHQTYRRVRVVEHLGMSAASRTLEYDRNLTGITRTPESGPYFCRVIPLGNGEQEYADDGVTTYDEKLTIEEVNGGKNYLSDPESEMTFRIGNDSLGYSYPTVAVSYSTDDPEELIALAREDLHSHTRPSVSYEGTVRDFRKIGFDATGIALGDEVLVIDRKFNKNFPLKVQERVIRIEHDELHHEDTKLTIGKFAPSVERSMAAVVETVGLTGVSSSQSPLEIPIYNDTPELPVYTVSTPSSEGISYTTPSYSAPDYSSMLSDYGSRISAIESGRSGGGDGWVHQVDGVTQKTGTIDFKTVSSKPSGSGSGSSSGGGSSQPSEPGGSGNTGNTVTDTWGNTGPDNLYNRLAAASGGFVLPGSKWGSGT